MKLVDNAPLSAMERKQLQVDAVNVRATAERKGLSLTRSEEVRETAAAKDHFELGCWLFYYSRRVDMAGQTGLKTRIEAALRLFLSEIYSPSYDFFTVFDFGERQFDAIFEMGDADQVVEALRNLIPGDRTGRLAKAFSVFGWPLLSEKAAV